MLWNQLLGKKGESLALACLEAKGWQVIKRNWRVCHCNVSLIASDENAIHFIEVRPVNGGPSDFPEQSFTRRRLMSVMQAGRQYLATHPQWKHIILDVLLVTLIRGEAGDFRLIENIHPI